MGWQLKGDPDVTVTTVAGVVYGLDDTLRTFESMGMSNWTLKFQHLADDFFTYTLPTKNAKGLGVIVPRDGQEIQIFYDGVRKFRGHVIKPKLGLKSLTVAVYGPWWWMGRITLSSQIADETGGKSDRATFGFPTQGLRTSLRTLINRAVSQGVPMDTINNDTQEAARISGIFQMLKMTLSNMSHAAAMAELLSLVPDAVAWFDYSPTVPELNITRRDNMAAQNFTVGATGTTRVESAEIYPRTEQRVRRVDLKFMKRQAVTGLPQWATQTTDPSNTDITTQAHRKQVQIITVSGPETLAFVPKNEYDSVNLKTEQYLGIEDFFKLDTTLAEAQRQFGPFKGYGAFWGAAGWARLVAGQTPPWLRSDYGLKSEEFTVNGWFNGNYVAAGGLGGCANYLRSIGRLSWNVGGSGTINAFRIFASFTVTMINLSYPTKTKVYKKWDHDFLAPPAGLAADLKAAQDWTPWEGPVVIAQPVLDGYNGLQRKVNLTNSHPDHAGMAALVKAVTYEGGRHRVTWDLGPPARTDLNGLVNNLRRNPQDNIIWL